MQVGIDLPVVERDGDAHPAQSEQASAEPRGPELGGSDVQSGQPPAKGAGGESDGMKELSA